MSTIPRRTIAGLVFSLLAVAAIVLLLPRALHTASPAPTVSGCDLNRGPCTVRIDERRSLVLTIAPRPIPAMQPLTLSVSTRGFSAPPNARFEFSGIGMDMGPNVVELRRAADDRLLGEGSLPVCVTGSMEWQAELVIATGDALPARTAFRFFSPLPAGR